ncbi:M28 family peptidase [Aquisediminimonas sediminicola]|uniref:M28 family peptidase n=1 Tax=Alteraquisediminimonas sediminicola TaxID=2676787 RepID=UPI001C8D12DF|nr:M28 family peptidase [Aquisediminimonas sediminicola]
MRKVAAALLLLAGLAGATHAVLPRANAPVATLPDQAISEADLMQHIEVLASDAFEGRRAGTEGEQKTIAYIAKQFEALGAVPDGANGQWFQPVPLVERRPFKATGKFKFAGGSMSLSSDGLIATTREEQLSLRNMPILFAGFGHQLDQAEVKDRLILLLSDKPPGGIAPMVMTDVRSSLAARGAGGVILVAPHDVTWQRIRELNRGPRTMLANDPALAASIILPRDQVDQMAQRVGRSLDGLIEEAGRADFRPMMLPVTFSLHATSIIRAYDGYNVVGRIRGRAGNGTGNLAGAIVLSAHHDHLGICAPKSERDRICNGAVDNASGVAMMIEVGRRLNKGAPLARDVILIATTAEELGLLGARYYAGSLLGIKAEVVAALNMDTVAVVPRGAKIGVIGRGLTVLDPLIDKIAHDMGREVDDRPVHNALLRRQDAWAFMQAGVPAVMVGGFFTDEARLKSFFDKPYHLPEDDLSHAIELGGAAQDADLMVRLARTLADPAQFPGKSPPTP